MKTTREYIELLRSCKADMMERYHITKLGIFGSVARGEQRENSDIDIVYEGEPDLFSRIRMKSDLEKRLGCRVDLVRFRKQIEGTLFAEKLQRDLIYV